MSGHSHAKTVMAGKMANAAKKGKMYSKYGRLITIAVKDGGGSGDPTKNSKLKAIIEQSKKVSMPKENIERAIKKEPANWPVRRWRKFLLKGLDRAELL